MAKRRKSVVEELAPRTEAETVTSTQEIPAPDAPKPDIFDEQIAAQQTPHPVVQEVVEATRMPEGREQPRSREARYTHVGALYPEIGMEVHGHENPYLSIVTLKEPASERVNKFLTACGFEPNESGTEYSRPIEYSNRENDRADAERVGEKLRAIMYKERESARSR